MRRITMCDVAKAAGVSQAAVSKILSQKDPWVSETTRQRVMQAAEQLGYRQNFHARLLRTGKTWCLGLMGNLNGFALDNYVYTKTCRGIEDELSGTQSPYSLLMFGANWGENHVKSLKLIERGMVDGLVWILLASKLVEFEKQIAPWLRARQLPFVVVHSLSRRTFDYPNVGFDSFGGAQTITAHLARGRRRVGLYLNAPDSPQAKEMLDGYRLALKDSGLVFDRSLLLHELPHGQGDGSLFVQGYRAGLTLPRSALPEAIFIGIDACAQGFIKAFRERGIRVPHDIAVAGFDDELGARHGEDELTTVHHGFREKGRAAVRMLAGLLDGSVAADPAPQIIIAPELMVRKSCANQSSDNA